MAQKAVLLDLRSIDNQKGNKQVKQGYCKECPKYEACQDICPKVEAELHRGPKGGRKSERQKKFEKTNVIYEHQMTKDDRLQYNELTGSLPYNKTRMAKWQ
jgi:sulfatase maturation enzyme AslB (radical SAM superfamily)